MTYHFKMFYMTKRFFVQINANTLPHYIVGGSIRPANLIERREQDIQSKYPNHVLLCNKKWSSNNNCSIEVILTESELNTLHKLSEDYSLFESIIPISRIVGVHFSELDKSETIMWNLENGAGYLPKHLIFVNNKTENESTDDILPTIQIENREIHKLQQSYNRFNRVMGGFAFMKTAMYDLKDTRLNFPLNYIASIGFYNDFIRIESEKIGLRKPHVIYEILSNNTDISNYIGKEISDDIISKSAKKEKISLESKFGSFKLDSIPNDTLTFKLAILNTFGKSKSKSIEDLLSTVFEDLEYSRREEIALIYGLNTGYEALRNFYKLKERNFIVKFELENKLDYYIIESIYNYSFNHKKSEKFDFIEKEIKIPFRKQEVVNSDYLHYQFWETLAVTKRKDYIESLELIVETIIKEISHWLPKNIFSINFNSLKMNFVSKVKATYLNQMEEVKKDAIEQAKIKSVPIKKETTTAPTKSNIPKLNKESQVLEESKDSSSSGAREFDLTIKPIELSNDELDINSTETNKLRKMKIGALRKLARELNIKGCQKDTIETIILKIISAQRSTGNLFE